MDEIKTFIGFGSNLGEREKTIASAIALLGETPGIRVEAVSRLVETEPVGFKDQPMFMNCVAAASTTLAPLELLSACLTIEKRLGRQRRERWGPRIIDLDILLYGDASFEHPDLKIPHPEISRRSFVMAGLEELGVRLPLTTHG